MLGIIELTEVANKNRQIVTEVLINLRRTNIHILSTVKPKSLLIFQGLSLAFFVMLKIDKLSDQ